MRAASGKMKEDNTPTVTSRRRKLTPHQRLRLDKAKQLKQLGALTKKKRDKAEKQKAGAKETEEQVPAAPRIPRLKKDTLSKPAKPAARFRKRQIHKSWLPTHLYHAKRARMTLPKEPLWRFAIPVTPTDKCYRLSHRAASLRGCVAWDMSYMATVGVQGVEASLIGLLRNVGVEESLLTGKRQAKWRRGTRSLQAWIRERDAEKKWIAKVEIMWCVDEMPMEDLIAENLSKEKNRGKELPEEAEQTELPSTEIPRNHANKQEKRRPVRKLLIRVHPAAFLQAWNEILKVAKIQRPAALVEDLRFEMGSIEIIGPESTEAMIGALHPLDAFGSVPRTAMEPAQDRDWVDVDTPEKVWDQLATITNPATLPVNAVLGFCISDPRLHHPPRTVQRPNPATCNEYILELISSWPPDQTQTTPSIFDRTKRLTASRQLASQKAINRRKSEALPGAYPDPCAKDPKIPVLLMASRSTTAAGQGLWTLLLPWDCVLPVWYSLMHYPLASGGNPRFGGLQERRQIFFEHSEPWFPADYPGTKAGYEWELSEREKCKIEWEKRPKGKRTAWESVDLGDGRKGEIGVGWACDWGRLFLGPPPVTAVGEDKATSEQPVEASQQQAPSKDKTSEPVAPSPSHEQPQNMSATPPLNLCYLPSPTSWTSPIPSTALTPVHITIITVGHPTRTARIYRLPSTDNELRAKWTALALPSRFHKKPRQAHPPVTVPKDAPPHVRAQRLAASLLNPPASASVVDSEPIKAGTSSYPCVPDEIDLIGFVTTGNYHLGEGNCEAIGNVAVAKVMGDENSKGSGGENNLCIVRESGYSIGRLARWRFV